jgi:hypothetical protein
MPSNNRIGLDNEEIILPTVPGSRQKNPKVPIRSSKLRPAVLTLQNGKLLPKCQVFQSMVGLQSEEIRQEREQPQNGQNHGYGVSAFGSGKVNLLNAVRFLAKDKAFPEPRPYRYALLDRDSKSSKDVTDLLISSGIKPKRIGYRCPWQNGGSERWVGSCRREILDHVIILDETHLRRLIRDYITYYHEDRIRDSLDKDSPATRAVSNKPDSSANIISFPRVGGLHHR